jgi:hypothetical protein
LSSTARGAATFTAGAAPAPVRCGGAPWPETAATARIAKTPTMRHLWGMTALSQQDRGGIDICRNRL